MIGKNILGSSYNKVIQAYQRNSSTHDSEIVKDYFPTAADFARFSEAGNQYECLEINQKRRWCDAQLTDMLKQNSKYLNLSEMSVEKRNLADPTDSAGNRRQYPPIESGVGIG